MEAVVVSVNEQAKNVAIYLQVMVVKISLQQSLSQIRKLIQYSE